jgi:DNA-binding response OmpR family regulator
MNQTSPATRHSSLPTQVLVVDDEESIVTICQIALRRMNLQVETAMTAAEAVAKARQSAFDLVLIDWILPDGNGLRPFPHLA